MDSQALPRERTLNQYNHYTRTDSKEGLNQASNIDWDSENFLRCLRFELKGKKKRGDGHDPETAPATTQSSPLSASATSAVARRRRGQRAQPPSPQPFRRAASHGRRRPSRLPLRSSRHLGHGRYASASSQCCQAASPPLQAALTSSILLPPRVHHLCRPRLCRSGLIASLVEPLAASPHLRRGPALVASELSLWSDCATSRRVGSPPPCLTELLHCWVFKPPLRFTSPASAFVASPTSPRSVFRLFRH